MCPTACAKAHPHQGCLKFPVKNNLGPYRAEQTTGAVHIALRDVVDHLNEQSEDLVGRWVVRCMVCVVFPWVSHMSACHRPKVLLRRPGARQFMNGSTYGRTAESRYKPDRLTKKKRKGDAVSTSLKGTMKHGTGRWFQLSSLAGSGAGSMPVSQSRASSPQNAFTITAELVEFHLEFALYLPASSENHKHQFHQFVVQSHNSKL